jgi:hypothetical protein
VIQLRHRQPSLWHSGLARDIEDLWEPWMKEVDQLLEDAALVERVYDAQGKRHRKSRTHGRTQTPAEVVLRLLILKHVRNWSYDTLEREVRANLVYRAFTRIGDEKVPDAKTLARLGQVIGPEVIGELHERLMELARERGVVQGRKMRVDTTVVETNIHYPTDSSLLGDGARVLTRTMKKVEKAAGGLKKRIRNRMSSVNKKVMAIALAGRWKGPQGEERAVSGTGEFNAQDCASSGGRVGGNAASSSAPTSTAETIPGDSRNDGQPCATGGAANQGASVSRDHQVSAQDRESFRAAHRNHSQGEGKQTKRVRHAGPGAGSREPDHHAL